MHNRSCELRHRHHDRWKGQSWDRSFIVFAKTRWIEVRQEFGLGGWSENCFALIIFKTVFFKRRFRRTWSKNRFGCVLALRVVRTPAWIFSSVTETHLILCGTSWMYKSLGCFCTGRTLTVYFFVYVCVSFWALCVVCWGKDCCHSNNQWQAIYTLVSVILSNFASHMRRQLWRSSPRIFTTEY